MAQPQFTVAVGWLLADSLTFRMENSLALRIDSSRMRSDFDALSQIGTTGDGGIHRPALGEAQLAARAWFRERIKDAGLEFRMDGAGNHSALLPAAHDGARTLLLGSHLDSVPHGGRFDGALGVLAALEILRTVKDARTALSLNLEAIDFTDEEGTLVGLLGSAAAAGSLRQQDMENPRGGRAALQAGMARAGLTLEGMLTAARPADSLAGYLELHIEQGPRLVNAGVPIGIVSAIVGISSYRLAFLGRADHAGTTPMPDRLDAGQGASAFILAARELVLQEFPNSVVNVGRINFAPGAFNIVPARAELGLEFRAPEPAEFERLDAALLNLANREAHRFGLELETEFLGSHAPTPMSHDMQRALADAASALGLSYLPLVSGAGHDAQSLAHLCPVGMLFVPSQGGASHAPREWTDWSDCVNGANVLLQAALRLAT